MSNKVHADIAPVGVIGGTGFYGMKLDEPQLLQEDTPFGTCTVSCGFVAERKVVFVARHGMHHTFLPHEVNYRANIYTLKKLGVKQVFAFCMAGALNKDFCLGDIVVPDQFIDLTHGRLNTFFGKGNSVYVSMADPFCPVLSSFAADELLDMGFSVHRGGTYVCVEGPHFSTRAESRLYSSIGDIVGMTAATEAKLAREAGLCYAVLANVVDYDTCSMGMKNMRAMVRAAQRAGLRLAEHAPLLSSCKCRNSLDASIVNKSGSLDLIMGCERSSIKSMFNHYDENVSHNNIVKN